MGVQLQGMEQLMRQIQQMGRAIEGEVEEKALRKGAEHLREKIEGNAPERTGKLKSEIIIGDVKDGSIDVGVDQQGKAFYGYFLEFGTSKMHPRPFIAPTLENEKQKTQDIMSDIIKTELGL